MSRACDASMPRCRPFARRAAYWWSEELAGLRRATVAARRVYTCRRRRGTDAEVEVAAGALREARNAFRATIRRAKADAWRELVSSLDKNPWGRPYKIVTKQFRPWAPPITETLDAQFLEDVVAALFPTRERDIPERVGPPSGWTEELSVTGVEMKEAFGSLSGRPRAPGPSGVHGRANLPAGRCGKTAGANHRCPHRPAPVPGWSRFIPRSVRLPGGLGLRVAPAKTEALFFHDGKSGVPPRAHIVVDDVRVPVGPTIKYLGLTVDGRWGFVEHFPRLGRRADALLGLMPNLRGPNESVRRAYMHAVLSWALYGAPVWSGKALTSRRIKERLHSVQRRLALRICRAYRTVSYAAAMVLAGIPPAEYVADALAETYARVKAIRLRGGIVTPETVDRLRGNVRRRVFGEWRATLENGPPTTGVRTVEAILPCLEEWVGRGWGGLSFHATQVLTRHGCFGEYLCRIGKEPNARCHHCDGDWDTAQHTLEACPAWREFAMTCQIKKFETLNDISINIYINEKGILPIRLVNQKKRLISSQFTKKKHKKYFCDRKIIIIIIINAWFLFRCLHYFASTKLELYIEDYGKLNDCAIKLPSQDDKWLSFDNYCRKERVPFVVKLEKPIYKGMCILDISKTCLYEFHHEREKYKMMYTDTDTHIPYIIECDIMKHDINRFDMSDYSIDNLYAIPLANKKIPGLIKNENNFRSPRTRLEKRLARGVRGINRAAATVVWAAMQTKTIICMNLKTKKKKNKRIFPSETSKRNSNYMKLQLANRMRILYFRGIFTRTTLPVEGVRQNENGIVNLDNAERPGLHWVAYAKRRNRVVYFDSFGNFRPPKELEQYLANSVIEYPICIVKIEIHTYNPYPNTTFGYSDEIRIMSMTLENNCVAFMFDEIRYEFCVPLNMLLGFCKDYLIQARNDYNCLVRNPVTEPEIELFKMQWRCKICMSILCYRIRLCIHEPSKRRFREAAYIIFVLQTGRKNIMSQDVNVFDDCNLSNVKLYLNSTFYPYDDLNLDFGKKRYSPCFIEKGSFVIIDCSRQNESVKSATVDVRIEFDRKENVPVNTSAYRLIIHDRIIEYCPLSNVVRKSV
ncbi:PO14 protein, partial [Pseudoatta argentina]